MRITFDSTVDDYRTFVAYMYSRTSTLRKDRARSLVYVAVAMIALYLLLYRDEGLYFGLYWATFTAIFIVGMAFYHRWIYLRNATKMYHEREQGKKSRGSILTLTDAGISAVSRDAEVDLKWDGIDRIVSLEDRTYIFLTAIDAIIVPRGGVTEGDYDAFIAAVKEHHAKSRRAGPSSNPPGSP